MQMGNRIRTGPAPARVFRTTRPALWRRVLRWKTVRASGLRVFFSSLTSRRSAVEAGQLKPVLELASICRRERGQALIEMTLVLPLLLVFLLSLVDFGIAIDRRQVLQHAVRDGVRFGAVGSSAAEVKAHVVDQAIDLGSGFTAANVEVCYVDENGNGNPGNAGDSIRVTANYTYQFSVGGGELLDAFGAPVPSIGMNPSAKLRLETGVAGANACL